MEILFKKEIRVLCQGITGKQGTINTISCIKYGTNIVAGISKKKKIKKYLGIPIFSSIKKAVRKTGANVSIVYVPAKNCKNAIIEAIYSGIKLIVCITEGIPILDILVIKSHLKKRCVQMIGPNTPGFIIPGRVKVGIMPSQIYKKGSIGVVSRSGTLSYEISNLITNMNLGQSICIGIGGDPIVGIDFLEIVKFLEKDKNTKIIFLIGEIGGNLEEKVVKYYKKNKIKKPTISYIVGKKVPKYRIIGHAGAIIKKSQETWKEKCKNLKSCGIIVVKNIFDIQNTILNTIEKQPNTNT
ncbi:succinate--CoA ligase subunit alpha [bacterium endosymbiont of Pedicinus badii]|uniref:succinate--CoA ligase subunit alpha n=1 Tax=bacterium endosymbiont of Pedicinus badii TaxID=1719126 RepID=UPI0009BAC516|nr:succinate--CoA ligase subunit alpha [bacterium endosymbiont of Pedicinus badii]OQM34319.1 succinyl-CoA synthetase subunit alpha [bacterium endosymbiont of Pedicinus badii]